MSTRSLRCVLLSLSFAGITPAQTPADGEVALPGANGWSAFLIHHSDVGVWYARVAEWITAYGAPEVVVTDDKGRLTVLTVYSGKWTAHSIVPDGQWLAPSAPADVDPGSPGAELYAAGKAGNLHRIRLESLPYGRFALQSQEIGHAAGEEFHTLVATDLLPQQNGDELLAFGISGAVYAAVPLASGDGAIGGFAFTRVAQLGGRVRDAVVVPTGDRAPATILAVTRAGELLQLGWNGRALDVARIAAEPMGLGRIARRAGTPSGHDVSYVTRDDGLLLRFERRLDGSWQREAIHAGAQGLRGVASGRFTEDPERESVAVYGYGRRVELVSRRPGGRWEVETIFAGEDQGHWLVAGELDGRNGTDELIASGFGGRVILLARPPGFALPGVAVSTANTAAKPAAPRGSAARPWRIAVKAAEVALQQLSPLHYQGGFETKSLVYETLVRRGADGSIQPGLAASWSFADGGRVVTFMLRDGAKFHDGQPVTAADVAMHFRRWVGLPEHSWLRSNERITDVQALDARRLRITLDRPHALLPDLCAINPTAIRGPGALDREGTHKAPIGSGPFAYAGSREDGRVMRYRRHGAAPVEVDLVRLDKRADDDPIDALLRGEVDLLFGSWLLRVDPARAASLRRDPRFQVVDGPGSSMVLLTFRRDQGPTQDLAVRRAVAAAIDRRELIAAVEHGCADPSTGFAAPSIRIWPQGCVPAAPDAPPKLARPLRLVYGRAGADPRRLAESVAAQLGRAGLAVELLDGEAGGARDFDLRLEVTHGVPYDPHTTLVSRFAPPPAHSTAESPRALPADPELTALVERAIATPDESERQRVYAAIQARFDETVALVPLYAPRRIAILPAELRPPPLDHDMYSLDLRWLTDRAR